MINPYIAEGLSRQRCAAAEQQGMEYVRRHPAPIPATADGKTSVARLARWRRSLRLGLLHG